jgi:cytochrome c oxidase cbb3-type subunit 2
VSPYTDDMIKEAVNDGLAQARSDTDVDAFTSKYPKANVRDFDGNPHVVSDMDALIAYLQVLGTMVDFKESITGGMEGTTK